MRQGKWICYPGDYEIMLAEKVQARRFQRGVQIMPFWRVDSPWHNVQFILEFDAPEDTVIRIRHEGEVSLFMEGPNVYYENFTGTVSLKKGSHKIHCWVYHPDGLPCICVDGEYFCSDANVLASYDQYHLLPASEIDCGEQTPNTWKLPKRPISAAVFPCEGGKVYDYGKIFMGYIRLRGCGRTPFRCYFGETLSEAMSDNDCEQITFFTPDGGLYDDGKSRAFRYLRIVTDSPYELSAEEEYNPKKVLFSFGTNDALLDKIVKTAAYTFSVCDREFYLDGAKRDRWLWEGDAYQAFRLDYYRSSDFAAIKRSIVALFGKPPVTAYINHIMDYTLYAILSVWEYYEHSGDLQFLRRIYPVYKEHMDYVCSRVNGDGFLYGLPGDWVFVDWNSRLDTSGELSFEQILFYLALSAFAKVSEAIGEESAEYRERAGKLKAKTDEVFWDDARGVYRHSRKEGTVGEEVSAYANMFAVLYGIVDAEKREKIKHALLFDKSIPPITTPYMQSYKLSCLFELGEYERAVKEIIEYWGGMVNAGAKTFWEYFETGDTDEPPRPMYNRPFGMSRCHIWGSSVLYRVPRYFYGIRTDIDFGESFEVRPVLSLIRDCSVTVALKRGYLSVQADGDGNIKVYSSDLDGCLIAGTNRYAIRAGRTVIVPASACGN